VEDVERSLIFLGTPALDIQRRAGVRAVQSTPLVSRSGRPLGMFSTHYTTPQRPEDRVLRLLDLLARQAADIIERGQHAEALRQSHATLELRVRERTAELRRLTSELTVAEQRERQHLAQVLHDGLQQLLVAAQFHTTLLERHGDRAAAAEHTGKLHELLAEALTASRSLTAELSPPVLQAEGLLPALDWLAHWMQETHGLTVAVQAQTTQQPETDALKVFLFQSVRELLFNVVKHAGVRDANVTVTRTDAHIQILVTDRGQGFDPAHVHTGMTGGMGLGSIRQRLEFLGGSFDIWSAPKQGSRFTLTVPLSQA